MPIRILNDSFWEVSTDCLLESRFRFGSRPQVTKFVFRPDEEILVLGGGRETPSHKTLMSAYTPKEAVDTSGWVRGIVLRERQTIYYRQGVLDTGWYDRTTAMLKQHGLPAGYQVAWGPQARLDLKADLEGYP